MDTVNFSVLAPRYGTRPLYSGASLGVSSLNGGAINWGNMWNTLKSVGSSIKSVGNKLWNSKTSQAIRKELNKTNVREKLAQSVATGVHGALDLVNQQLTKELDKRLDRRPLTEDEVAEVIDSAIEPPEEVKTVVELPPKPSKRPREDVVVEEPYKETLVVTHDEPPSYEEAIREAAPIPVTIPAPPPRAKPLTGPVTRVPAVPAALPAASSWIGALNAMTGVGLSGVKRRRCY